MSPDRMIPDKRLDELLAKERAHDDYRAALLDMAQRRARIERGVAGAGMTPDYRAGWVDCLREFTAAIVKATRERTNR